MTEDRSAISPSRAAFAIVMIAVGLWGFVHSGFVAIWAPGIQQTGLRGPAAFVCSAISTFAGAGLLWSRSAYSASRILLAWLVVWLVWCKGIALIHAPAAPASWESAGETAVIIAATWTLASDLDWSEATGPVARSGPRILYGLALIAFGVAHFGYPGLTASLVPAWLPWHLAWVYLTGTTYVAAGTALVTNRFARPAAILSALQMALFGALVWVPKIADGARDADTLNEAAISFALAVSGWVIATAVSRQAGEKERAGRNFQPSP